MSDNAAVMWILRANLAMCDDDAEPLPAALVVMASVWAWTSSPANRWANRLNISFSIIVSLTVMCFAVSWGRKGRLTVVTLCLAASSATERVETSA